MTADQWRFLRDVITYFTGLAGIVAESIAVIAAHQKVNPELLAAFLGMLGLPSVMRQDERNRPPRGKR